MPLTVEVPDQYAYVLGVAASTTLVNLFLGNNVMKQRKASGITYPNLYATNEEASKNPAAYKFNCAQRAHGNFLEAQPSFLVGLLITGLRWPVLAASLGAGWVVSRVIYAIGYTNNGPKGRMGGSILAGLCGYSLCLISVVSSAMYFFS